MPIPIFGKTIKTSFGVIGSSKTSTSMLKTTSISIGSMGKGKV